MSKRRPRSEAAAVAAMGQRYPEVRELLAELARRGVELGGAPAIVLALAQGPERYAAELAADGAAWERFRASFDALRTGRGTVSTDPATLGALAWIYVTGAAFTAQIRAHVEPSPLH
jgi:hypothetical protein